MRAVNLLFCVCILFIFGCFDDSQNPLGFENDIEKLDSDNSLIRESQNCWNSQWLINTNNNDEKCINLIDGDPGSVFDGANNTVISIDLKETHYIHSFTFLWNRNERPQSYLIEGSNDNNTWEEIQKVTLSPVTTLVDSSLYNEFRHEQITSYKYREKYRYLRITCKGNQQNIKLHEFKLIAYPQVFFPDSVLDCAIRLQLPVEYREIYAPDLLGITEITVTGEKGRKIRDLCGIEQCKSISKVDFTNNELHSDDLFYLSKLNLDTLILQGNEISDISNLIPLSNLQYLNLAENSITSLAPLMLCYDQENPAIDNGKNIFRFEKLTYLNVNNNDMKIFTSSIDYISNINWNGVIINYLFKKDEFGVGTTNCVVAYDAKEGNKANQIKPLGYTLAYDGNGHESGTVPFPKQTVLEGVSVTIPDNSANMVRRGFRFMGWAEQADGGAKYEANQNFIMPDNNVTLYAVWEKVQSYSEDGVVYTLSEDENSFLISGYNGNEGATILSEVAGIPVEEIEPYVFYRKGIKKISIPASIAKIGDKAFMKCDSLISVEILGEPVLGVSVFASCKALNEVSIKGENLRIPRSTFRDCYNVQKVEIPSSLNFIGDSAFYNCFNIGDLIFDSVDTIGSYAFKKCWYTEKIKIAGVKSLGTGVFDSCYCVDTISLNGSINTIPANTFRGCHDLKDICVPDSIKRWGNSAFSGCEYIVTIDLKNAKEIGSGLFYGCKSLKKVEGLSNEIRSIGWGTFYNCIALDSFEIPEEVDSIGDYAFSNCTTLESVTFPESLRVIGNNSFAHCNNLKKIELDNAIESIGSMAFQDCFSLKTAAFSSTNAPRCEVNSFSGVKDCELVVLNGATGFDKEPWIDERIFKLLIQKLING